MSISSVQGGYKTSDMTTPEAGSEAQKSAGCLWTTDLEGQSSLHLFGPALCWATPVNKKEQDFIVSFF